MKFKLDELKAAIAELESRSDVQFLNIGLDGTKLTLSCEDRTSNILQATLYHDCNLGAQFSMTHRLMYMKDKKRLD